MSRRKSDEGLGILVVIILFIYLLVKIVELILSNIYVILIIISVVGAGLFFYLNSSNVEKEKTGENISPSIEQKSHNSRLKIIYQNLINSNDEKNWITIEYTFLVSNDGIGIYELHSDKDRLTRIKIAARALTIHNIFPKEMKKEQRYLEQKISSAYTKRRHWISIPKKMGYTVGINGLSYTSRKSKLEQILFTEKDDLPRIGNNQESKWGDAKTCKRLRKIHDFLIDQANMSKNHPQKQVAFAHYIDDLNWLKKRFYLQSKCYFTWGTVNIDGIKQND